jgi:hypothetical protein
VFSRFGGSCGAIGSIMAWEASIEWRKRERGGVERELTEISANKQRDW